MTLSDNTILLVLLLDLTTHQVHALGIIPGLEMSSSTIQSTCEEAGMTPHCAESSESQECVSVGQSLPTKCPKPGKQDCSVVQHVLVHRSGPPEVWKTDEDTSSGRIVWQNVTGEVDLSGKGHENFHALCQYFVPTTTTTTACIKTREKE